MKYAKVLNPIDVINPYYLTQDMEFKELNKKSNYVINSLCELTK